ncbi:HAMP domain-containing histidine kinase [Alcaligenaceae bacterium 429]|nr:HAMP domain-containing histidine kinase [Alcaligenaceae bacterium 429]
MKLRRSLSGRITLVLTLLIFLAVSLSAVVTYAIYTTLEENMLDTLVQTESKRIAVRVSRFGDHWQQPFERDMGPSMYAWGETDTLLAPSMPEELRELPLGLHYIDKGNTGWHVQVADVMDGRLYVLYDSVVLVEQSRHFALALAGIVLFCTLLALFFSKAIARWLVTPINTMTERLTRWLPSDYKSAIPHTDEEARLMEIFNRAQDQVDATIANQREFTANLHHEIRTPLSIIRSDAELMLRHQMVNESERPRLQRIVHAVQDIKQSLESTYSLCHAGDTETRAEISLYDCVQDAIEGQNQDAENAKLIIKNQVDTAQRPSLNQHALMTVIRNILRNAIAHAAPATLTVTSIENGLQFTDDGPGIAADELSSIFERYFSHRRTDQLVDPQTAVASNTGSELEHQAGLGLAIAKRVCHMQSWQLEVTSPLSDGHGACFTLRFHHQPHNPA